MATREGIFSGTLFCFVARPLAAAGNAERIDDDFLQSAMYVRNSPGVGEDTHSSVQGKIHV